MTSTELMYELMKIKKNIEYMKAEPGYYVQLKKKTLNLVNSIIIDLLDEESSAMQKMNRLTDAIEQAVFISKEIKEPFKVEYKVPEINLPRNAAKEITKFADKIRERYNLNASKISLEDAEKMAKGGTD